MTSFVFDFMSRGINATYKTQGNMIKKMGGMVMACSLSLGLFDDCNPYVTSASTWNESHCDSLLVIDMDE